MESRLLMGVVLWVAIAGAALEIAVVYVQKQTHPLLDLSRDFVWMAPLALVTSALLTAAPFLAVARIGASWARALALFVPCTIVVLNVLMLLPGIQHYALAVLAAGLAAQLTRMVLRSPDRTARFVRRTMPWLVVVSTAAAGWMWTSLRPTLSSAGSSPSTSQPRNVLLISLDTVRAANLSLYGYARRTSPVLEALGARGVVFENAFSTAPWTLPSHASLFTGRWPFELSVDFEVPLDGTYPTVAEYLGAQGYATAGFVANMKYCSTSTGLARGFQHYEDYPRSWGQIASSSTVIRHVANNFRLRKLLKNDQHLDRTSAEQLNGRVLDWLSARGTTPFFLFVNYFDAHEPYLPPPPFDRQFGPGRRLGRHSPLHHWLWNVGVAHGNMGEAERQEEIDAYDGALAYLDRSVGELVKGLDARGLLNRTIILITADHGEEFAEHGVYEHGYSLYRAGIHVPLLVIAPGLVPAGLRVTKPVSLRDVPATIVDLLDRQAGAPFPGHSLARGWRAAGNSEADADWSSPIFSEVRRSQGQPDWFPTSRGAMASVTLQDVRYIRNGDNTEELYDFRTDPWERRNLVDDPNRRQVLAEARAALNHRPASR